MIISLSIKVSVDYLHLEDSYKQTKRNRNESYEENLTSLVCANIYTHQ
jgi:hypothetical protein